MKRVGPRGSGRFEPCSWEHVIEVFAEKIRKAIEEDRKTEVMYHVGRPGADGYMDRVLQSWGVDGHNSHTNVCSAAARLGYATWSGADRPSPDHEHAKFMLLISSHLETGHYFNPHAQRIVAGQMKGAKVAVIDVRLSNTASRGDYWLAPWPGTEAFLLLAMAHVLIEEDLVDDTFLESWTNWRAYVAARREGVTPTYRDVQGGAQEGVRPLHTRGGGGGVRRAARPRRRDRARDRRRRIGVRDPRLAQRRVGQRGRLAGRSLPVVPDRARRRGRREGRDEPELVRQDRAAAVLEAAAAAGLERAPLPARLAAVRTTSSPTSSPT